jgi:methionyl aminopeptidase
MSNEIGKIEDWIKAGEIASKTLNYGKSLIKPGTKAVDVLDKIEEKIIELGGKIAFPPQVSCNEIAAHWCADIEDSFTFSDEIVSLDCGVHVNGCIGDTAITIDLSKKHEKLIKASEEALYNAIKIIKPGIKISEIGKIIKETIVSYGYLPIHNLSGHGLGLYKIHTTPTIPNFDNGDNTILNKGDIIAIEPFATNGKGFIQEGGYNTLYSLVKKKPVRSLFTRELIKIIEENYKTLPFTKRWLIKKMPLIKINFALKELLSLGIIKAYPPLIEVKKGLVSQREHTIIVDNPPKILTLYQE